MLALEHAIDDLAARDDFSGVVSVDVRGDFEFAKAYGLADRRHGIANTVDTQFAVASGAKGLRILGRRAALLYCGYGFRPNSKHSSMRSGILTLSVATQARAIAYAMAQLQTYTRLTLRAVRSLAGVSRRRDL